uniref:Uncharacterized protein n=1 Tax=Oncorhynchus tshawytscha TaxID=74940 RepID=A0A8C8HGJ6_ONCTS
YFPQEMNSNGSFQPRAFPDSNVQMESFDNQQLISMMISPSGSLNMSSPVDYNSYSPQESYTSSCYNSPNRMDSSYGFVPEHYHYQHCNLQHCYCLSHWSGTQESISTPEYAIYGTTDCVHASPVDANYFRRELSSSEMCYL